MKQIRPVPGVETYGHSSQPPQITATLGGHGTRNVIALLRIPIPSSAGRDDRINLELQFRAKLNWISSSDSPRRQHRFLALNPKSRTCCMLSSSSSSILRLEIPELVNKRRS